jgi:site-specific DNA-methyltransferase (adenine-specific)
MELPVNQILCGDALEVLKELPDECIDCVVTSPPYWGLRDYGTNDQLGHEKTFEEYVDKLCDIFDEVKRVLKREGTCWVNIGDCYITKIRATTLPEKCLAQIPARFAIEMCGRGWILRNEIIWQKLNAMPASAKDRFTVDFEKIFFFTKVNKGYYFEQQFEPFAPATIERVKYNYNETKGTTVSAVKVRGQLKFKETFNQKKGRNMRSVWVISTENYYGAHVAPYPKKLIETPIKAGCPEGGVVLDPFMGSGTTAVVAKQLQRNFIGIEINPEYVKIAEKRIQETK